MYYPPSRPQRPFNADYPSGAPADATGGLTHDIEGRPLTARYVVGRRVVGGDDQALPAAEFNTLAEATTGRSAQAVSPREMGQDFGRTVVDRFTGRPLGIEVRNNLQPDKGAMVYAHVLGHVIDQLVGQIPSRGLSTELRGVYNTLNNPNRTYPNRSEAASWGGPFTPQALGYKGDEVGREYMVEGIRAYLADPNYLKTVAPKTAAAIRDAVNSHPVLSKIIQFNALAALMAGGTGSEPSPVSTQSMPALSQ